jgi:hypothetical protein
VVRLLSVPLDVFSFSILIFVGSLLFSLFAPGLEQVNAIVEGADDGIDEGRYDEGFL